MYTEPVSRRCRSTQGVAVASSVYAATRSRERAFVVAAVTGLVEPLAAGLSAAVLSPFLSPSVLELALLGVHRRLQRRALVLLQVPLRFSLELPLFFRARWG